MRAKSWLLLGWGAVLLEMVLGAGPGYLVQVGPTPLRLTRPEPRPSATNLPPLGMFTPVRGAPADPSVAGTNAVLSPPAFNSGTGPSNAPPAGITGPEPAPPSLVLTPDSAGLGASVWLPYLMPGSTSAAPATVVTPVGFVPPQPLPVPPSKATYSTAP